MNNSEQSSEATSPTIVCIESANEAIEMFRKKRQWALYNDNRFDMFKFILEETKHRSKYDFSELKPVGRIHSTTFGSHIAGTNTNPVSAILSPKGYSFFIEKDNFESCFSVHTEEAKQSAIDKGYVEIKVKHYSHPTQIPVIKNSSNYTSSPDILPNGEEFVPPKNKSLKIYKLYKGEKFAQSVVRAFEENYYYKITDSDPNFLKASPCLKWTKDLRKKNGLLYTNNPFYSWCSAYLAIKIVLKDIDVKDIKKGQRELKEMGTTYSKGKKTTNQNWHEFLLEQLNTKN